ncbi:unnamed protein product [Larinioides sclopetarius]|uniref:Uncharacterized protein n=1 Tax=Larinioides sclopetarius TaxID=280406 RepID=A0AAV2C030_9ARAC
MRSSDSFKQAHICCRSALFYGVLCILMTVLATVFGNLIQAAAIVWAMCGGPILAVFLLGMLTTRTNEKVHFPAVQDILHVVRNTRFISWSHSWLYFQYYHQSHYR